MATAPAPVPVTAPAAKESLTVPVTSSSSPFCPTRPPICIVVPTRPMPVTLAVEKDCVTALVFWPTRPPTLVSTPWSG